VLVLEFVPVPVPEFEFSAAFGRCAWHPERLHLACILPWLSDHLQPGCSASETQP
jgi:hypothetical protein